MRKGENASNQHFFPFYTKFSKAFLYVDNETYGCLEKGSPIAILSYTLTTMRKKLSAIMTKRKDFLKTTWEKATELGAQDSVLYPQYFVPFSEKNPTNLRTFHSFFHSENDFNFDKSDLFNP